MDKLDLWEKRLSEYEKLSLADAKKLYIDMINDPNENKRKIKRNKLICGTLYVIQNFVKSSSFDILSNSSYDIDDIMNICTEFYIKLVDNGELLKIDNFSQMFNSKFFTYLDENLVDKKYSIGENLCINTATFSEYFSMFIELKMSKPNVTAKDLYDALLFDEQDYTSIGYYNDGEIHKLLSLFENIYSTMNIKDRDNCDITQRQYGLLKYLLIDNALRVKLDSSCVSNNDEINKLIDEEYADYIINVIENSKLTDIQKNVLYYRCGFFDEESHTLEETAKKFGYSTREGIRQIEKRALSILRNSYPLKDDLNNNGKMSK